MTDTTELHCLSDDELLQRLSDLVSRSRRVESELIAHIAEVDERKLYARELSSMFAYSTEVLHLSEHEAYVRITAARASRKYPMLLEMLRDGTLHLSGIGKLAPHLTEENHETLLARACHKSKRQIEELLVEISPKPDVPAVMRKLPDRAPKTPPRTPVVELGPERVTPLPTTEPVPPVLPTSPASTSRPPGPPAVEPLAPARYRVQFTASGELRGKLERLQALMQGELAEVIEAAVTEKLERLEAKRYAETKSPRKSLAETDTSPRSRYIPAAVRRAVRKRDGDRCRFESQQGRRCTEWRGLEFHHHDPFGRGGRPRPRQRESHVQTAQCVSSRAGLRERRVCEVPRQRRSRLRAESRLRGLRSLIRSPDLFPVFLIERLVPLPFGQAGAGSPEGGRSETHLCLAREMARAFRSG